MPVSVGLFCSLIGLFRLYVRSLLTMVSGMLVSAALFCSLVGLFCSFIKSLLTLVHTSAQGLVLDTQVTRDLEPAAAAAKFLKKSMSYCICAVNTLHTDFSEFPPPHTHPPTHPHTHVGAICRLALGPAQLNDRLHRLLRRRRRGVDVRGTGGRGGAGYGVRESGGAAVGAASSRPVPQPSPRTSGCTKTGTTRTTRTTR
jgi:hypothetical protein